ncbi:hypothetical protein LLEC1_00563 [Akanthomyces lecanii]|uniref:GST N-terminal domain-containing protein n=1 Tax=Cordyceps confragosa TaxID=2714763 RepID=A0A179I561_CORDF|nr:hypothetical protein LLEC1_00563 [Akanthomyces lecanii]
MLTLHHSQRSQSERIVWLCEELGLDHELKTHPRDPKTMQCAAAPVIQDGRVTLAESGAIVEYILTKYGHGELCVPPEADLAAFFSNRSFKQALQILNDCLKTNKWLAGDEFTAADIMNVFVLTTVRLFVPYSLEGHDAILACMGESPREKLMFAR